MDELLDIVDEHDHIIGQKRRILFVNLTYTEFTLDERKAELLKILCGL